MPKVSAERMEATRRRVLDGARRAFAEHGYEGATVRLLEERTGLSRGAIFHHFPDKDALFLALAEEDAEEVATVVDRAGLVEAMRRLRTKDAGWLASATPASSAEMSPWRPSPLFSPSCTTVLWRISPPECRPGTSTGCSTSSSKQCARLRRLVRGALDESEQLRRPCFAVAGRS